MVIRLNGAKKTMRMLRRQSDKLTLITETVFIERATARPRRVLTILSSMKCLQVESIKVWLINSIEHSMTFKLEITQKYQKKRIVVSSRFNS